MAQMTAVIQQLRKERERAAREQNTFRCRKRTHSRRAKSALGAGQRHHEDWTNGAEDAGDVRCGAKENSSCAARQVGKGQGSEKGGVARHSMVVSGNRCQMARPKAVLALFR